MDDSADIVVVVGRGGGVAVVFIHTTNTVLLNDIQQHTRGPCDEEKSYRWVGFLFLI